MPRKLRVVVEDGIYHVINRRVAGLPLFDDEGDYRAFEKILDEAAPLYAVRILAYCLMPNHWHLLLIREIQGDVGLLAADFADARAAMACASEICGVWPVYQGRFKSFPIQDDDHLLVVARYIERNALRANLVKRAENWPWCSLYRRTQRIPTPWLAGPQKWPVPMRRDWLSWVNHAETARELDALRRSVNRGAPFGDDNWQKRTAHKLKLQQSLREPWRPKNRNKGK